MHLADGRTYCVRAAARLLVANVPISFNAVLLWWAGLHAGLRSLIAGGVPPRFLIIDDGWQCTNVDKALRQPPSAKLMPASPDTEDTSDEFLDAEIEMLYMGAQGIPPSSSAGGRRHEWLAYCA